MIMDEHFIKALYKIQVYMDEGKFGKASHLLDVLIFEIEWTKEVEKLK